MRGIAEQHVEPIIDHRHRIGETDPLDTVLREVGFHEIRSKRLSRTIRFQDESVFARLNAMALVSMSEQARMLDNEGRQHLIATIPIATHVVLAKA